MTMQFVVIEGADEGQIFVLPEEDTVTIGTHPKNAYIVLHDLEVARIHCEVDIKGESVAVSHHDSPTGTLVNGIKISDKKKIRVGDIVRVGNTQLRLQVVGAEPPPAPAAAPGRPAGPNLWDQLHGAAAPAKPGTVHLTTDELDQLSGQTLGNFELGDVLGKRHWGVVFRARDLKKNQTVALRVLADYPANDQEMQTFSRVMKTVMPIRHPHIVALHTAGKTGPYGWIAMEFIEGESLVPVLERLSTKPKIKWLRGLRVGIHIARALVFTHERHLVHGHITPGNILTQSADNIVKLNDLVLHQAVAGSESAHSLAEERWQDNLPYRSPEQTYPNHTVDDLADQYALGAIMYVLLTGRYPFEAPTAQETVTLIRYATPVRPTEYQPGIPAELQAVVLRMMARRPEDRYPTPADVLEDLEKIAADHGEEL